MFRLTNGLDDLDGFKKNQLLEIGGFIFWAIKRIRETWKAALTFMTGLTNENLKFW